MGFNEFALQNTVGFFGLGGIWPGVATLYAIMYNV